MKSPEKSIFFFFFVFLIQASTLASTATAKSTIEPCSSNDTCNALLGYTLYTDLKVSEVASLFQVDPISLLLTNAIDISYPDVENHILPSKLFLKIPITCSCVDGIRKSISIHYKTQPLDNLGSIADSVYGGLVSAEQIQEANSVKDLDVGTSLVIPLPCVCFNGTDNSLPAVYLSYVVKDVDTLAGIARRYSTTITDLTNVNAMGAPNVSSGDILAVPLSACASNFSKNASDFGLIVPMGSYALAAGHCVQCSCALGSRNLYCEPTSLAVSCSSLKCIHSSLMLGNFTVHQNNAGCKVTTCSYNGFNGTILTMLFKSLQPRCPGPQQLTPLLAPPDTLPKDGVMCAPGSSPDFYGPGSVATSPGSFFFPPSSGSFPGSPANGPAGSSSTATSFSSVNYFITFLISVSSFSFVFSS